MGMLLKNISLFLICISISSCFPTRFAKPQDNIKKGSALNESWKYMTLEEAKSKIIPIRVGTGLSELHSIWHINQEDRSYRIAVSPKEFLSIEEMAKILVNGNETEYLCEDIIY